MTLKKEGVIGENKADDESKNIRETIATNIVAYRKKLKLSRAELAKKVGVTEAAIGQYERGTRTPIIDVLCKLANVFNVPVDNFVEHDPRNYDAVQDYRFRKAADLLQSLNFFVTETLEGVVEVCVRSASKPQVRVENGIITRVETQKNIQLVQFTDRQSFIEVIEDITDWLLTHDKKSRDILTDFIFGALYTVGGREEDIENFFRPEIREGKRQNS